MLRVKKNYNLKVSTKGYLGELKDAPQKVLKHLKENGFAENIEEVEEEQPKEKTPRKYKNKNKKED